MKASVVLTRPQGKNEQLGRRLQAAGFSTIALPALSVSPLIQDGNELPPPGNYDLIVFVSSGAVAMYLDLLGRRTNQGAWPERTMVATVGRSSAQPLYDSGLIQPANILHPDPLTQNQDSEALWSVLQPLRHCLERVLIIRGESGRDWLGAQCEQAGIEVERLALYRRAPAVWEPWQTAQLPEVLASPELCVFLLTSGESVDAVHANIQQLGLQEEWAKCRFVVIHERVACRLQSLISASGKVEPTVIKVCSPCDDAIFHAIVQLTPRKENS